jgi:transcriptional regulator GlxA family with amidase domain
MREHALPLKITNVAVPIADGVAPFKLGPPPHWRWTAEMADRYPRILLDPQVLYVDTGTISTSAGTAAGIDLGLHLLRRAHGATVAAEVARRMVVPPHRDGGQAQYLRTAAGGAGEQSAP